MPQFTSQGWAALATLAIVAGYELLAWLAQRWRPEWFSRSRHALLREQWFIAVSTQRGSELLAVQTLRNSMMSASMLASTAALALMGTLSLTLPSLRLGLDAAGERVLLELALVGLLFAALTASVMAVRDFNHVSFIAGLPVGSEHRLAWHGTGRRQVRRAGVLYSIGLRQLLLTAPVVMGLLRPGAGPVAAVLAMLLLLAADGAPGQGD